MRQFDVSVVLPAKNEAKNLSALLLEISEVVPNATTEIIIAYCTSLCCDSWIISLHQNGLGQ